LYPVDVLIACSNRLLRESVARIVNKRAEFRAVAVHTLSAGVGQSLVQSKADVFVLDSLQFVVDDNICFLTERSKDRSAKCILVAMEDDEEQFMKAVRLGVLGYVLREASAADVVAAIRMVASGEAVFPAHFGKVLFDHVASYGALVPWGTARGEIRRTRLEQQLIPLIDKGLTNEEIANELDLSEKTIKSYLRRILRKSAVKNRENVSSVSCVRGEL
jgi:NarL family two-component system response regulator LiaR